LCQCELVEVFEVVRGSDILCGLIADGYFAQCQHLPLLVELDPHCMAKRKAREFDGLALLDGHIACTLGSAMHTDDIDEEGTQPMSTAISSIRNLDASNSIIIA